MFLTILVFLVASTYWYITGHYIPAILGYLFILIFLYADELYFVSLVVGVLTLISIIVFIVYDYNLYKDETAISYVGISALYMLVIFLQSREVFNADQRVLTVVVSNNFPARVNYWSPRTCYTSVKPILTQVLHVYVHTQSNMSSLNFGRKYQFLLLNL